MFRDMNGEVRYKVGLHVHTSLSDGRLSPEEVAEIYKSAGYDAIALTDHWVYGEEKEINGLKILSGCEYNLGISDTAIDVIHIVGVGMNKKPEIIQENVTRQGIVDAIKKCGGFAIWAHPAWSLNSFKDTETVSGFNAVEIYNTVSNVNQSCRPYSGYFVDVLANNGIIYPLIATDDSHYYNGEDATISYIMVKADSNSQSDIMGGLLKGEFYATQGPELHIKRDGDIIMADCSQCVMISFLSNASWAPDRNVRGDALTYAEYKIKPFEKWIRVEVLDKDGNRAWSNIIDLRL